MINWNNLFTPHSIALVGASKDPVKVGHILWEKLKGYGKKLFVVNPNFGYKTISDIDEPIDLAVIAIPAPAVPGVIDECIAKNVKAAVVTSSGFSEMGESGIKLQSPSFPVVGPNCFGVANPKAKLDTTFAKASPPPGNIGLISQSGALASYLFNWAKEENLGFSKFLSLGNRLNLNENDCLEYLAGDPSTKVIALYLESFADPYNWLKIASRISKRKPVVVLLGGQTTSGAKASLSHTASLSPKKEVSATLMKQVGAIIAKDLQDFANLLEVFSLEPALADNDLAIITNAGGPAILATDTAASLSLDVEKPIDVLGDALADRFQTAFDQVIKDKHQDAFLIIITPQANTEITATCQAIAKRFKHVGKPVIVSLLGGKLAEEARQILKEKEIATIDLPEDAVEGIAALLDWHRQKNHSLYPVRRSYVVKPKKLHFDSGTRLSWSQSAGLAAKYQITLVKTSVITKPEKPALFGWPVVLKADPGEAIHRTENKAIYLNVQSNTALKTAYLRLKAKFNTILIQEQLTQGHELFVGISREANFPPLLTIGQGGIYTELYQDVVRAFLPANQNSITQLLKQTKIGKIIFGYRTGNKLAADKVIDLIMNLCRLMEDYEQIKTLEVNPALVAKTSLTVVDLKINF